LPDQYSRGRRGKEHKEKPLRKVSGCGVGVAENSVRRRVRCIIYVGKRQGTVAERRLQGEKRGS